MKKVKLKNCGDYVVSPKISTNELSQDNYITTDNMLPNKAGITKAENVPLNLKVTQFLENDILLSNIRPYFKKIWLAEFMGGCSADVLVFRTNENYDSTYIKYCLSQDSFFAYDMAGSKGSKMPRGDKNHILNFELLDLDITNQRKIGHLLKSIDDKIAINNQINAILERVAKAIYEYYFVQFDFPNQQGKPYKSSGGAMRFDSTLNRPIPKDFEVKNLLDIIEWTSGAQPPKSTFIYEYKEGYVRFIQNRDYQSNSHITYIKDSTKNKICNEFDIMMDKYGEAGKVRFGLSGAYNVAMSKISVKIDNTQEYVRKFLEQESIVNYLKNACMASTRASLNETHLENLYIVIPDKETLKEFEKIQKQYIKTILHITLENQKLKNLRDFLLPLLINAQAQI